MTKDLLKEAEAWLDNMRPEDERDFCDHCGLRDEHDQACSVPLVQRLVAALRERDADLAAMNTNAHGWTAEANGLRAALADVTQERDRAQRVIAGLRQWLGPCVEGPNIFGKESADYYRGSIAAMRRVRELLNRLEGEG